MLRFRAGGALRRSATKNERGSEQACSSSAPLLPKARWNAAPRARTCARVAQIAARTSEDVEPLAKQDAAEVSATGKPLPAKPPPEKATKLMNIVFCTSEVSPWSKTGGLADVLSSLPITLAERGHRVMVVTPRYKDYPGAEDTGVKVNIQGSEVGFYHYAHKGVDWVFIDSPGMFMRPGGRLYGDEFGDFGDNQYRFMVLSLAALEAPLHLKFSPEAGGMYGQDCVFVANDWMAALVPVYLAAKYRPNGTYKDARSVLAIHNLAYQGVFPPSTFQMLGLPDHWWGAVEWQYPPWQRRGAYEEEGRAVNSMKAGICTADRIVTVSPGYAEEIKTYLGGWDLDPLLVSRNFVLSGIVNGIDTDEWSPEVDPHIPMNYGKDNFVEGKKACKRALQQELGLPVDDRIPLLAFIGRLDPQKGADILLQAAPEIMNMNVQLVCLGSGSKELEDGLRWLERQYKNNARGWVGFNVPFSHRLTAAADILLMPSRFEPCGLNQLYAMRYGTVPVAHKTGGLKDTVIDFDPWNKKGTGWTYTDCSAEGLVWAAGHAIKTLRHHNDCFRELQVRGMERDASWNKAAKDWEQVFEWAKIDKPYASDQPPTF